MNILIGQEGTSYLISGAKAVTVSGLWFAPVKGAITIKNETTNKALVGTFMRNITITASGNDYIIDYSGNTTAPAMVAGAEISIYIKQPSFFATIISKIDASKSVIDYIKSGIDSILTNLGLVKANTDNIPTIITNQATIDGHVTTNTGKVDAVKTVVDAHTASIAAVKTNTDTLPDLTTKVDSIQASVNALSVVTWQRSVTVSASNIAECYVDQPVYVNSITGVAITEIRKIYTYGTEEVVILPFMATPGMKIRVIVSTAPPFTCVVSGAKQSDSKNLSQNIALGANPFPGLPYIGTCVWDSQNSKMIIVQAGSAGINVGLYENTGKIIQEFESRFGSLNSPNAQSLLDSAANSDNFYYIACTNGVLWYNKTTKVFGVHSITGACSLLNLSSLGKVIVCNGSATINIIDTSSNTVTPVGITTAIYQAVYCSAISRLCVINYAVSKVAFVDLSSSTQDGVDITIGATNVRYASLSIDGNSIYFSGIGAQTITRILLSTRAVTNKTTNATNLSLRHIFEYGNYVYVFCSDNRTWVGNKSDLADVKFIANTGALTGTSAPVYALKIGTKVYVTNGISPGYVSGLDLTTETAIAATLVNDNPATIVLHPQTNQLYVGCNNNQNGLSIIQL